jgi:hypothetical protein
VKSLFFKLGLSFFFFGLINNGTLRILAALNFALNFHSTLCDNTFRRSGPGTSIDTKGDHSILQYISCAYCKSRLAIYLEGKNTICQKTYWVLPRECERYDGMWQHSIL